MLVVGRDQHHVLGLMLSSRSEHDNDPNWLPLGPGAWDDQQRPSWVRLDRILRMRSDSIRREGAALERHRFDTVARALRAGHGWR